jgi:hypothetical protein
MSGIPSFYLVLTHVEAVHLMTILITIIIIIIIIIIREPYKLQTPVPTSQRKKLSVFKGPIRGTLIRKYSLLIWESYETHGPKYTVSLWLLIWESYETYGPKYTVSLWLLIWELYGTHGPKHTVSLWLLIWESYETHGPKYTVAVSQSSQEFGTVTIQQNAWSILSLETGCRSLSL